MANYAIPNYPTRRVRYYNNQFLKDQDFIDDQAHRLSVSQAYLRALCVAGVCEGMTLRIDAQKKLQIAPGTAIDPDGKLIALDVERPGPLADNLADGDYLVHIRFAEEEDEMAPPVAGGAQSNTRFTQKPIFGATKRGIALPPGAVVLGTFAVTQTAVASQSAANRQFSGVRLPGPSPAGLSTLRHLGAGDDSATLTGGLAIRRDAASALGPTLSLVNGSGGVNAATAIDLASYDPAGNDPPVRVGTFDDGQYSSHLVISTKKPGAITNNLVERLRITSDGKMIAAAPTTISSTLSVTGDTTLAKTTAASLAVTADAAVSGKLAVAGDVALNGKHAFRANDTWLRLNQDAAFTSGVHTPGNFAPGALNVGGANGYGNPGGGNAWIAGVLRVFGTQIENSSGFAMLEANQSDWLRINPASQYPATAMYQPVAIGTGGLCVGAWEQLGQGLIKATAGSLLGAISVGGGGFHGTSQYPYETIQLDPGNNLRICFGTKQRFYMENSGSFRMDFDRGSWVFQTDGNLVKYNLAGAAIWALNKFGSISNGGSSGW